MRYLTLVLVVTGILPGIRDAHAQRVFPSPDAFSSEASASPGNNFIPMPPREKRIGMVNVTGNQRIAEETVRSYLSVKEGEPYTDASLNKSLKNLYATGLFADVKMDESEDGNVSVEVKENPVINRIRFEGNDALDEDELLAELPFSSRSVYTRNKIQRAVERLVSLYQKSGRYTAKVEPKIVPLSQNRVDVVFEIQEGDVTHVEKIFFVGNEAFDADELRDVLNTKEEIWYDFLTDNDTFDKDRLEFDKETLRRYYTSRGYADFRVTSAVAELAPDGKNFYLTFSVEEGTKYRFGTVFIDTEIEEVDTAVLRQKLTTLTGDDFDADAIDKSVEALSDELGALGYAFVDIDPEQDKDVESRMIDVTYKVKPSPRVYVERIDITGNVRTLDRVIRREFRFAEGDPFSTSKLKRTEQRLKNLGFFSNVNISTTPGSSPDRAVINVSVDEQSTGQLSLGAGFSTADGALAEVGVTENNLLGAGKKLRANATLATKRQQIDFGFTEPYFLDRDIAAGFDIFKIQQDWRSQSSYNQEMTGGRLRATYALTENLSHTVSYTAREDIVSDVQDNASRYIKDQQGAYTTSAVGHVLMYDRRDNRFQPDDGYFLRFTQDAAGLGGNAKYLRNELRSAYYYTVVPDWVMQFSANGGYVWGYSDQGVRINDRFFVGVNLLRGFTQAGIGPRDISTGDALGGNMYYTGGAELRFPLPIAEDDAFTGGLFVDAGSLWDTEASGANVVDDAFAPRVAAGVGVAWKSPFGPVRLDFGQAIVKESYDETQLVRFSFGTQF